MRITGKLAQIARVQQGSSVITGPLRQWAVDNTNGPLIQSKQDLALIMKSLSSTVRDRSGAFHPSSLFKCKRYQVFEYIGVPQKDWIDARLATVFADGNWRHIRLQLTAIQAGVATHAEYPLISERWNVSGSADLVHETNEVGVEIKGTSSVTKPKSNQLHDGHDEQIQTYLFLSGYEDWYCLYESKSSQDWYEVHVTRNEAKIREIIEILNEVNEAVHHQVLPPVQMECRSAKSPTYRACPYSDICLKAHDWPQTP